MLPPQARKVRFNVNAHARPNYLVQISARQSRTVRLTISSLLTSDLSGFTVYNDTYRQNKASKYTHENVCIVPGGRAGLSRIAAVVGDVYTVSGFASAFTRGIVT